MLDLEALFEKYEDEFLRFERIESPRHPRADVCAFLVLHDLCPDSGDIVSAAEHDEIFLSTNIEKLAEMASEEDIVTLIRCGVRLSEYDCLAMFV